MKRQLYILASLLLLTGCTSRNEVSSTWDAEANVEYLWQTIDTKYCYIEEKNIDWNAIHDEYILRAKQLNINDKNYQEQLFDLCANMLDSLQDGHVNLYSWFDISSCKGWYENYPINYNSNLLYSKYLVDYRIAGGLYYTILQPDSIGYIQYSSFSNSAGNIAALLAYKLNRCRGLIIDVRNNTGGNLDNAYTLAAPFVQEEKIVGYWQHKSGPGHNDFSDPEPMKLHPHEKILWLRPTVVLSNRRCYSATNFYLNCMKGLEQVTIVGGKSGGGGGMPMSYELPCGWSVRFSSIKMLDQHMQTIENGINPDIEVTLVSTSADDLIEKARAIILEATSKNSEK